jgi:hypothetical protein
MLSIVKFIIEKFGYIKKEGIFAYPDVEEEFKDISRKCEKYTMTSIERMYALYKATEYVVENKITGDVVECGVWKGGSSMLCALTLLKMGESARKIYLYDTYAGMSEPKELDIDFAGQSAKEIWLRAQHVSFNECDYALLDEVQANLLMTGYPSEHLVFVKGKVEDTIPGTMPDEIAILRLDTDWYESTYHELLHLFPRLSKGGVLLIDDYGHWKGARMAVDTYFDTIKPKILLNRIDYTGRIGIKT